MIGIEGLPDTGKTEFSLTAPPSIVSLAIDRGWEHVLTKPTPPRARQKDIYLKIFKVPKPGQAPDAGNTYKTIWDDFYGTYKKALEGPYRTVVVDGDSETWDLQQLAAFGKVTQVPQIQRVDINQARRVMISRAFDSGKNIIFTYRVKAEYENTVKVDSKGIPHEVSVKTGEYKRSGFSEQDYQVQVQLRSLSKVNKDGVTQFGVRVLKCKPDRDLVGTELWGQDCNFTGLVQTIYPESDLAEWGL
jgi:hypothetical protein